MDGISTRDTHTPSHSETDGNTTITKRIDVKPHPTATEYEIRTWFPYLNNPTTLGTHPNTNAGRTTLIPYIRHQEAHSQQEFAFRTIDTITATAQIEFFQIRSQHFSKHGYTKEARVARKLLNHCESLLHIQHDPAAEFDINRPPPGDVPDPSHRSRHKNFEGGLIIQASAHAAEQLYPIFNAESSDWPTRHAVAANITALSANCRNLYRRIHKPTAPAQPRKDSLHGIAHEHDAFMGTHRLDQLRNEVLAQHHESTPVHFSNALVPKHQRRNLATHETFEPESFAFINDRSNYTDTYHEELYPLIVYFHQGQKIVQLIDEPYPVGFPPQTAIQHLNGAIDDITEYAPYHDHVYQRAQTMLAAAMLGVHNLDFLAYKNLFTHLQKHGASNADLGYVLKNIAYGHAEVASMIAGWTAVPVEQLPDKSSRLQVTDAAREAGMTPKYLYNLARTLGATGRDLAFFAPSGTSRMRTKAVKHAKTLNIPDDVVSRIKRAL